MLESLLKFFGIWSRGAEDVVRVRPAYHSALSPALLLLIFMALVAGVIWLYRREEGEATAFRRAIMAACRILFLVLLVGILLRPVAEVTVTSAVRETMAVLVDTSSSMKIADVREEDADRKRAAIALGKIDARGGLTQTAAADAGENPARIDLVKAALASKQIGLLSRIGKEFDLAPFTFDRQAQEIAGDHSAGASGNTAEWITRLTASGGGTALGDAIRSVIIAKRGQALAGIVVVSDGASNSGSSLAAAGQLAREEHLPLYIYGVGITSPKDIVVSSTIAPDVAFVNDELPVTVRVRSQGLQGHTGLLVLKMDGEQVDQKEVSFDQEGEQMIAMKFTPGKVGDFSLEASIAPRAEEIVKDNNTSAPKHLRVVDGRIRVLHIEQSPRWEFKYLQAMLLRDRRVDYRCWLLESDPGVVQEKAIGGGESPYLEGFPKTKEELLRFDLVIMGDVDPKKLPPGAMEALNGFVANFGGGFIMIAGPRASPQGYRYTPIEQMLPVELDLAPVTQELADESNVPIHLELTPAGKAATFLRLAEAEPDSLKKWEQLPPIYWESHIARAKPAAEVLIVDDDPAKATRFGKMPVMALQQYGLGQVLYMGTDNTWRWRRNQGEEVFNKVWSQVIERMALAHMLGLSKRTQLSTDKEKYATGDRVTLYARLYRDKDFEPLTNATLKGFYTLKGPTTGPAGEGASAPREVLLRALPDQPGMYRAEFIAPEAGTYQFKSETDSDTSIDFLVAPSNIEMGETALNEKGLRDLAEISGGAFVREEDLFRLPERMRHLAQPVLSTYEVEIWSTPAYFAAVLLVVTIEWFLRKRAQLK